MDLTIQRMMKIRQIASSHGNRREIALVVTFAYKITPIFRVAETYVAIKSDTLIDVNKRIESPT